jgi:hypothetical protein
MIDVIESDFRETGIECPKCGYMTYSDGKRRPRCSGCLLPLDDETIWTWLITLHDTCPIHDEEYVVYCPVDGCDQPTAGDYKI